jgi:fructose-bisphosphate aldolase class II
MPLVTLNQLMEPGAARRGVGLFNVAGLEFAEAILAAAEELNTPVILGLPERFFQFYDIENVVRLSVDLAQRAKVPTVVHIDHGKSFDCIVKAMRYGVSSVMFDGSTLPYEENLQRTAEIVRIAHTMGVSVEGELGYVGRGDDFNPSDTSNYTQPEQAADFVRRTGVDALAVAVGTAHGIYKAPPKLDFERLQEIRRQVDVMLVLHGGSGLTDQDFQQAIACGIDKVNVFTELSVSTMSRVADAVHQCPGWIEVTGEMRQTITASVKHFLTVFNTPPSGSQQRKLA